MPKVKAEILIVNFKLPTGKNVVDESDPTITP